MDKTKIKKFAINARNQLIADVTLKAELIGITNDGIQEPTNATDEIQFFGDYSISGADIRRRQQLVNELKTRSAGKELKDVLPNFIEEVAYTWFNRLIAIRFMEVNHYLPGRIRILSSETPGQDQPDIVKEVLDSDLDFTEAEREQIKIALRNQTVDVMNDLYKMIFIKAANKLNEVLPELFEKLSDYSELLFTPNYIDVNGVIHQLVHNIDEADFDVKRSGQVEIIGWLYQYYNTEPHERVVNITGGAVKKEDIPAATQLFTTDWVVRYMVDNSLGKYLLEHDANSALADKLTYLLPGELVRHSDNLVLEDIKVLDNAMGSGHILVYAFDVLMEIYEERGYSTREAAVSILEHNLFGLEIDKRAYQLAYFALMMKAREYNRSILSKGIKPNVYVFEDITEASVELYQRLDPSSINDIQELVEVFEDSTELGSIIRLNKHYDIQTLIKAVEKVEVDDLDIFNLENTKKQLLNMLRIVDLLQTKYEVVVTNPPYMNKFEPSLKKYISKYYQAYKGDLFSVFIFNNSQMLKPGGYAAYMTPFVWMFIKTYEALRTYIINNMQISSLIQMEYSAFEEATVPINTFIIKNTKESELGAYVKLSEFTGGMNVQDEKVLEIIANPDAGYLYHSNQANFKKIPGSPIAYWASEKLLYDFEIGTKMSSIVDARAGVTTGDNSMFIRLWFEVSIIKTSFNTSSRKMAYESKKKWFPYNKGGAYRKWYGNYDYLVNWENDGQLLRTYQRPSDGKVHSVTPSKDFYFREAITWSDITSGSFAARLRRLGSIHDVTGMSAFGNNEATLKIIAGILNSKVSDHIFKILNPTIHLQIGNFQVFPIIKSAHSDRIISLVSQSIDLTKEDWDSSETSWDFTKHPLLIKIADHNRNWTVEEAYTDWAQEVQDRRDQLKANEEELNRIFIDLYGLQDELTPEVADKDLSVQTVDQERDIKSFLSYFIGVVFGRYSLDQDGLTYAGGDFDFSKYHSFMPNQDDLILLTDQDYFGDQRDIINRFKSFLTVTFGESHLNDNLTFIAEVLGGKGTPEEVIRNYFFKDFWKDHVKTYKKRPIYWLLDSGRNGGFRALVYLHRYDEDTMAMIRTKYVQELQMSYDSRLGTLTNLIDNATDSKAKNGYIKQRDKLNLQLDELITFETKIAYLANKRITLDLDDGVVVNYQKVQTTDEGKNLGVFKKI